MTHAMINRQITLDLIKEASRAAASGAPTRVSGSRRRFQRRPVAIVSTDRTAPVVPLPPWTYSAYGRPTVASKIG